MTVGQEQIWERETPLLFLSKLSPLCDGYLESAMADRGRERTRNLEPSDRMGVFSPPGWNLWPSDCFSVCLYCEYLRTAPGGLFLTGVGNI